MSRKIIIDGVVNSLFLEEAEDGLVQHVVLYQTTGFPNNKMIKKIELPGIIPKMSAIEMCKFDEKKLNDEDALIITEIKKYIHDKIKPASSLKDAVLRFKKIKLAVYLMNAFVNPDQNEVLNDKANASALQQRILSVFAGAIKLESKFIGGEEYPDGYLGSLIIAIRRIKDKVFSKKYHEDSLNDMIYAVGFAY